MPARSELVGLRFGSLTILASAGRAAWTVRCDCGRKEAYPQRRLTHECRADLVRACSACRAPACIVCSKPVVRGYKSTRLTCEGECNLVRQREVQRQFASRAMADPARRDAVNARRRARMSERLASDPDLAAALRERDRQRWATTRNDPTLLEAQRARTRAWYAANRDVVQANRRAYLDGLSPEALARWLNRVRAHQRAYRARHPVSADPAAHRRYLDRQAEYRRRRRLLATLAQSSRLREMLDAE